MGYFDEIFFKPNLEELERIYSLNAEKIKKEFKKEILEFKDLQYYVIPIEEDYFYIYDKSGNDIISDNFTNEQLFIIKLCIDENIELNENLLENLSVLLYNNEKNDNIENVQAKSKLHVGCGRNILEGWINLDIVALPGVDIVADLDSCKNIKLPLKENSIDEFYVSHVIEHIKNPLDMEELHRVAMPNAKAIFKCPYGSSDEAFEDPTHVRQYFLNSFGYFSQPCYWRADYGYRGDWEVEKIILIVDKNKHKNKNVKRVFEEINLYRNIVNEMIVELKAIKPIREPLRELKLQPKIEIQLI